MSTRSTVGLAGVSTMTSAVSGRMRGGDLVGAGPGDCGAEQAGGEDVVGAAVEGSDGDDVPAVVAGGGEQGGGEGGHSAGEGDGLGGAFQFGEGGFEAGDGGVPEPLVDGAAVGGEGAAGGELLVRGAAVVDGGQWVGGGQVDGWYVHAEGAEVVAAGVHGPGVHRCHG